MLRVLENQQKEGDPARHPHLIGPRTRGASPMCCADLSCRRYDVPADGSDKIFKGIGDYDIGTAEFDLDFDINAAFVAGVRADEQGNVSFECGAEFEERYGMYGAFGKPKYQKVGAPQAFEFPLHLRFFGPALVRKFAAARIENGDGKVSERIDNLRLPIGGSGDAAREKDARECGLCLVWGSDELHGG